MKLKKITTAVLAAAVLAATPATVELFSPFSVTANAVDVLTEGDYEYSVNEDGDTVTITKYVGTDIEVIIPSTIGGRTVTVIGADAFHGCKLTGVEIPNSITSIGASAFYGCKLTSVMIPDGVTSIGKSAFWDCDSLENVMISNSVTDIDRNPFGSCPSLKEIFVDDNNELFSSVEGVLFNKDQTKLICYPAGKEASYDVPSGVTEIGEIAFHWCKLLTSVTIPDSVTTISKSAFYGCTSLTNVKIPDKVATIEVSTFSGCHALTNVTLPNSVKTIEYAFSACSSLGKVNYSGTKAEWEAIIIDADNFYLTRAEIICTDGIINEREPVEELKPEDTFVDGILKYKVLDDGTLEVKGFASADLKDTVKDLMIPEEVKGKKVTEISGSAFYNCESLTSVIIPNTVTEIGETAFGYCTSLINVIIPNSVMVINSGAFRNCESLIYATIPENVRTIGMSAFMYCESLSSVTIPDSVVSIGYTPFWGCKSLKNITVGENNANYSVVDGALCNKAKTKLICYPVGRSDKTYTIPYGITKLDKFAFYYGTSLESVTLPDSLTEIDPNVFRECTSLSSVTIPDSITKIGEYAFYHCGSLKDVYYAGTEAQWNQIDIDYSGNDALKGATIHYNSTGNEPDIPDLYTIDFDFSGVKMSIKWGGSLFEHSSSDYDNNLVLCKA